MTLPTWTVAVAPISAALAFLMSATAAPPVVAEKADVTRYSVLWEAPLFARPSAPQIPVTSPQEENSDAIDLRLAGWGEAGGSEIAVAFHSKTFQTFVLDSSSDQAPGSGAMRLLKIEHGDGQGASKALVEWNGRTFWIHPSLPGAEETLPPALTVDSRAARLRSPVLLTNDATMDDWTGDATLRKPGQSRVRELHERHNRLRELFGR